MTDRPNCQLHTSVRSVTEACADTGSQKHTSVATAPCNPYLVCGHFARLGGFDIATILSGKVNGHRAWLHALHHVPRDQQRCFLVGDKCCADDDVDLLALLSEQGHLHTKRTVAVHSKHSAHAPCMPSLQEQRQPRNSPARGDLTTKAASWIRILVFSYHR